MSNVSAALIPCDGAIFSSGKWTLAGAFCNMYPAAFPVLLQPFWLYCRVSDAPIGEKFELVLQIAQANMDEHGAEVNVFWTHKVDATLNAVGPSLLNPTFDFAVPVGKQLPEGKFTGMVIPRAGVYEAQALFNNRLIGASMITIVGADGGRL